VHAGPDEEELATLAGDGALELGDLDIGVEERAAAELLDE
jgi:hypothetical protein